MVDGEQLGYEAVVPGRVESGARKVAWISLLSVGILSIVFGFIVGGRMVYVMVMIYRGTGGFPGFASGFAPQIVMLLVLPIVMGNVDYACAMGIRRRSRKALVAGLVVVCVQFLGLLLVSMGMMELVARGGGATFGKGLILVLSVASAGVLVFGALGAILIWVLIVDK